MAGAGSVISAIAFGVAAVIFLRIFLFNGGSNNTNIQDAIKGQPSKNLCYLAAIYEHQRIGDTNTPYNATWAANINLLVYERVAELASSKGAAIVVFPESSLYKAFNRTNLNTVVEEIPEPNDKSPHWNPCNQRKQFEQTSPKITRLSCLAKRLHIYIVCNLSEKQPCNLATDKDCPKDGHFNYNTDVVFDDNGNLIARYRKYNIFNEELFHNVPSKPERIVFDTPFGRMAVFTCFDMVFDKPAIDVVLKDKAQTILYPTRWYDELPFFTAIQAQSAWSYTMNVNMLAANGHLPRLGTIGSGLYSGRRGPIIYKGVTMTQASDGGASVSGSGSFLMLANIPVNSELDTTYCNDSENTIIPVRRHFKLNPGGTDELNDEEDLPLINNNNTIYNHMNMEYNKDSVDKDIILDKIKDYKELCVNSFCCNINYEIKLTNYQRLLKGDKELILFARNHVRPGRYKWYEQSCFMATIEKSSENNSSKRIFSIVGNYQFEYLKLEANFDTRFVFEASANNVSTMVKKQNKSFKCSLSSLENQSQPHEVNKCSLEIRDRDSLNVAGLYGRLYDKDESIQ